MGDECGVEGQNQSKWGANTCIQICADFFDERDCEVDVMCAGDDVIAKHFLPPSTCPAGAENDGEWAHYFDRRAEECFKRIQKRRDACFQPLNADESVIGLD